VRGCALWVLLILLQNISISQDLTIEQLEEDCYFIIESIESVHPFPYKYLKKDSALIEVEEFLSDSKKGLTVEEFANWSQSFLQNYQDSHLWIYKSVATDNNRVRSINKTYKPATFKVINDSIGYLNVGTFRESYRSQLQTIYKEAFHEFNQQNCTSLIVDVGHNNGGSTYCVKDLMNYLTEKRYQLVESYYIKQSEVTKARKKENNGGTLYWSLSKLLKRGRAWVNGKPGKLYTFKNWKKEKSKSVFNKFSGDVHAISSNQTHSVSTIFIASLKYNNIAKVWGQPTYDNSFFCGNGHAVFLPNSGLTLSVPAECQKLPGNEEDNEKIQPDVLIENDVNILDKIIESI